MFSFFSERGFELLKQSDTGDGNDYYAYRGINITHWKSKSSGNYHEYSVNVKIGDLQHEPHFKGQEAEAKIAAINFIDALYDEDVYPKRDHAKV
jgi:hypothetical protein